MGQVTVTLNGRTVRLRCRDGEEERVLMLAEYVQDRIEELAARSDGGDDRTLALAALVIADELFEAREQLADLGFAPTSASGPAPEVDTLATRS